MGFKFFFLNDRYGFQPHPKTAGTERSRRDEQIALLTVRVKAGARREEIIGFAGEVLRVAVQAPPVEGAANQALIRLLARSFGTSPSRIELVRGRTSKTKTVSLLDVTPEAVQQHVARLTSKSG